MSADTGVSTGLRAGIAGWFGTGFGGLGAYFNQLDVWQDFTTLAVATLACTWAGIGCAGLAAHWGIKSRVVEPERPTPPPEPLPETLFKPADYDEVIDLGPQK